MIGVLCRIGPVGPTVPGHRLAAGTPRPRGARAAMPLLLLPIMADAVSYVPRPVG